MAGRSKKQSKLPLKKPPTTIPDWPILHPLLPESDLSLETILEDQIVIIRKLFTASLSQRYVTFLSTLPLITTPAQPKKGDALRINDRFEVNDPVFANQLWTTTGLEYLLSEAAGKWGGDVCGLNPRIRIYRYKKGQYFDQHCR